MTQTENWQPSDIESNGTADDANAAPKRRGKPLSLDSGAGESRPTMTLDRDNAPEQAPPTLDVQQRLRDTAETCIRHYESWRAGNDGETELTNGLHELRRVLARIEIELAASHADETAQRPIPIPLHRAHKHGADSKR
jgi:hypothetical protein